MTDDEICAALCDILEAGLLAIRKACSFGNVQHCQLEADHLHNLPGLIKNFKQESLLFYWNVERKEYIAQSSSQLPPGYFENWNLIENYLRERFLLQ